MHSEHCKKHSNDQSRHQHSESTISHGFKVGPFDYQRLDAYRVALEALCRGEKLANGLGRGYAKLSDQLRRALLSAYLGVAEAASRKGADRSSRFRTAKGEASEAAAALEAVLALELASAQEAHAIINLCARLCAMLTRLEHKRR